ncbi:hypothetical protein BH09DEP1_BH09DEP1_4040 [soil metagenome]
MKQLLLFCILLVTAARGMELASRTTALNTFRNRKQAEYFPNVSVPNEQDWHVVNSCFAELLKLELGGQEVKVTFADAKRYCEFAQMYRDLPQAQEWFDADHVATIRRLTDSIMAVAFYPEGRQLPHFGPPPGKEAQVLYLAYEKVLSDPLSMSAILKEELTDPRILHTRFESVVAALRAFKVNPPQRNKLEANKNKE